MKKVLFKIIIQAGLIALWMITCYPVCNKAEDLKLIKFEVNLQEFQFWVIKRV